jgi:hypothetical protein
MARASARRKFISVNAAQKAFQLRRGFDGQVALRGKPRWRMVDPPSLCFGATSG